MQNRDNQANYDDQLAAYALGALDADEVMQVEAELARSAERQAELKALRDVVALLPYAAQPVEPPAALRRQLFARIEASQAEAQVEAPRAPAALPARRGPRMVLPAFIAALLLVMLGLGSFTWALRNEVAVMARSNQELTANLARLEQTLATTQSEQQALNAQLASSKQEVGALTVRLEANQRDVNALTAQLSQEQQVFTFVTAPGVATRTLAAKDVRVPARGEMYMYPGHSEAVVLFRGLVPLEAGKVYQFWLANDEGQIPAGPPVMVDTDGLARLVIKAPREVNAFTTVMLTVEPASGPGSSPSNEVVLEGEL